MTTETNQNSFPLPEGCMYGIDFNKLHHDKIFVKLTRYGEYHNDHQFTDGLNTITQKFSTEHCAPGGFYFIDERHVNQWLTYRGMAMMYKRYVTLPDDCIVSTENNSLSRFVKYKTDKFILSEKMSLEPKEMMMDFDEYNDWRIHKFDLMWFMAYTIDSIAQMNASHTDFFAQYIAHDFSVHRIFRVFGLVFCRSTLTHFIRINKIFADNTHVFAENIVKIVNSIDNSSRADIRTQLSNEIMRLGYAADTSEKL